MHSLTRPMEFLTAPTDLHEAAETLDARCGHGALAAIMERTVTEIVVSWLPPGPIGLTQMRTAVWDKRRLVLVPSTGAGRGLGLVQWLGSWPRKFDCHYRHWVAWTGSTNPTSRDVFQIYDVNESAWTGLEAWEALAAAIRPERATGHKVDWLQLGEGR